MIKTVHIINHTHTDIGYTDLPHKVKIQHMRHLDKAIDLCRKYADAPRGEQYRWTIESLWVLDKYLEVAPPARKRNLFKLIGEGLIELSGFYHQPLTQLMNLQELEEELRFGGEFAAKHKISMDTLMLNDIGGVSWNMPQIMQRKGLKNFILGTGGWRVMTPVAGLPHIFRYVGPDGSKAVMYHLGLGGDLHPGSIEQLYAQYGFGVIYLLFPFRKKLQSDGEKADTGRKGDAPLYDLIARLEKEGYAYDRLLLQCGMDNAGPQEDINDVVRHWNRTHSDISLEMGTASEFFSYIENKYSRQLPELSGELTCSWTEHVLTQGKACGLVKRASNVMAAADSFTLAFPRLQVRILSRYRDVRQDVMKNILLFKDHTFGITMWGWQKAQAAAGRLHFNGSAADYPRYAWNVKTGYGLNAWHSARAMTEICEETALFNGGNDIRHLALFNPLPYSRNAMVRFYARDLGDVKIKWRNLELIADREPVNGTFSEYSFSACGMPPASFAGAEIISTGAPVAGSHNFTVNDTKDAISIEYGQSVITLDKRTGSIVSWEYEGRQQVDKKSGGLNDFAGFSVEKVAETPLHMGLCETPEFNRRALLKAVCSIGMTGHHFAKIQVVRSYGDEGTETIRVETEIELRFDEPAVYIRNRIKKISTVSNEAGYFIFPFQASGDWQLFTNQQGYLHNFTEERLRGGAHQNIGFQDYVLLRDKSNGVLLAAKDNTVLSIGGCKYYNDQLEYRKDKRAWLYMYCFNNLWNTNCALEQAGEMNFDFIMHPLSNTELACAPETLTSTARMLLSPPLAYLTTVPDTVPWLVLNSPSIDYYVSMEENGHIALHLINMSRKTEKTKIKIFDKIRNMSFHPCEIKTLLLERQNSGDFYVL